MGIAKGLRTELRRQPIALLALFVALGGTSYAAAGRRSVQKRRDGRIYACVTPAYRTLNLTTRKARCPAGQRKVSWAVGRAARGPAGKRGPAGPAGPRGEAGPQGPAGVADQATLAAIDRRLEQLERDNARLRRDVVALTTAVADLEAANRDLRGRLGAQETLLSGVRRDGHTLRFEGMNVQLVNGEGSTETANGLGNLIVGYNEGTGAQTGSHVVAIGPRHAFTGAAGLIAGTGNRLSANYAAVLGGWGNEASGTEAVVVGGGENTASGLRAVVGGGWWNAAAAPASAILGGFSNRVMGTYSTISGGSRNQVPAEYGAIGGGSENVVEAGTASILGGNGITIPNSRPYGTYPAGP